MSPGGFNVGSRTRFALGINELTTDNKHVNVSLGHSTQPVTDYNTALNGVIIRLSLLQHVNNSSTLHFSLTLG